MHEWDEGEGLAQLEAIYPSHFRFITKYRHASEISPAAIGAARSYGRNVRDLFSQALTLPALADDPACSWMTDDIAGYLNHLLKIARKTEGGRRGAALARQIAQQAQALMDLRALVEALQRQITSGGRQ